MKTLIAMSVKGSQLARSTVQLCFIRGDGSAGVHRPGGEDFHFGLFSEWGIFEGVGLVMLGGLILLTRRASTALRRYRESHEVELGS